MNRSRILLVFLLQIVGAGMPLFAQSDFVLKGTITGKQNQVGKVYLDIPQSGKLVTDSADVVDGKYVFKGKIEEPILAYLKAAYRIKSGKEIIPVFIEPGSITVNHHGSFDNYTVKGSSSHSDYLPISKTQNSIRGASDSLHAAYVKLLNMGDSAGANTLAKRKAGLDQKFRQAYKDGITANPSSSIAPYLLYSYSDNGWEDEVADFDSLISLLPTRSLQTPTGRMLLERQKILSSTRVGSVAPDFVQNDSLGRPVRLSSFREKYVLLDFWAAWCVPCRSENPNYVQAFSRYKDQGLTIIGVSLDEDAAAWKMAIQKDGLHWPNVSDLRGAGNEVFVRFNGYNIPKNVLIDPAGKIIAKDLFGEQLEEKLKDIFSKEQ